MVRTVVSNYSENEVQKLTEFISMTTLKRSFLRLGGDKPFLMSNIVGPIIISLVVGNTSLPEYHVHDTDYFSQEVHSTTAGTTRMDSSVSRVLFSSV